MIPLRTILLIAVQRGEGNRMMHLRVASSMVTTVLTFIVLMLAHAFWCITVNEGYRVLAIGLVVLLAIPLITLGTASGRLSAQSRDDRLATLRLLGLSSAQVKSLAVVEATLIASLGIFAGTLMAVLAPLGLRLLTIAGTAIDGSALRLPWWSWPVVSIF